MLAPRDEEDNDEKNDKDEGKKREIELLDFNNEEEKVAVEQIWNAAMEVCV
jgi:hypothetical protein